MRRIYMLLLVLPLVLLTGSCQKNYVVPNRTIITDVGNWTTKDSGKTFYTTVSVPEIDDYFNDAGAVLVYASFDGLVYEQIPQVYNGVAYSYSSQPGQVEIDIQSSDGTSTITPPGAMTVKIVLVESAY